MRVIEGCNFPILSNVDFGRNRSMLPLRIGIEAELEETKPAITILESVAVWQNWPVLINWILKKSKICAIIFSSS